MLAPCMRASFLVPVALLALALVGHGVQVAMWDVASGRPVGCCCTDEGSCCDGADCGEAPGASLVSGCPCGGGTPANSSVHAEPRLVLQSDTTLAPPAACTSYEFLAEAVDDSVRPAPEPPVPRYA